VKLSVVCNLGETPINVGKGEAAMTLNVVDKHIRDGFAKAGLTTLGVVLGKDNIEAYALNARDLVMKDLV
jgi:hypothetical protein